MALTVNYPTLVKDMKKLYKKRDLSEDLWVVEFCSILQKHLLSAEVTTVLSGSAPSGPITGKGSGKLL